MSYRMYAEFMPAAEPKNGFIGHAKLTVGNALRFYGISVFENKEDGGIHIDFPGYDKDGHKFSYIVPENKEAYGAMRKVIEDAVFADDFRAVAKGDYNPRLEITSARAVKEPYADARYSMKVEGLCTLHGITTSSERESIHGPFVPVDMPSLPSYEKDGQTYYPKAFRGLVDRWTNKEGEEQTKDYGALMRALVMKKRKELETAPHPSLNDQMKQAAEKAAMQAPPEWNPPTHEMGL